MVARQAFLAWAQCRGQDLLDYTFLGSASGLKNWRKLGGNLTGVSSLLEMTLQLALEEERQIFFGIWGGGA